ncbi:carbonic anhydrase [Trueperella bonasi]|uniref:Carbonic anhydrase n=1 Tax=Trueperella bonasi TaxID=312286 RepID=A0ABT9NGW7_9ACTO|nr:carbonic anhydrase [Trueperella bonasi]MDP9806579.1 carbonic anhydrase [Trueperella bonasi]
MSQLRRTAPSTASVALEALIAGNERFANGNATRPHQTLQWRENLRSGQSPIAAVLGCSDSRVPTEIVFDVGLGDLFVMRTAGHTVDQSVLGSLSFAIEVLKVPLVVVVGHERCGAIQTAMTELKVTEDPSSYISPNFLVNAVAPAVRDSRPTLGDPALGRHLTARHRGLWKLFRLARNPPITAREFTKSRCHKQRFAIDSPYSCLTTVLKMPPWHQNHYSQ